MGSGPPPLPPIAYPAWLGTPLGEPVAESPKGARGPIPRVPDEWGTHTGASSGRPFFPDEIGLPIESLSTEGVQVTTEGIATVVAHTSRFGPDRPNDIMIERLRQIAAGQVEATPQDLNFYTHELREFERYQALGFETGVPADPDAAHRLWNNTHTATLEDYGLRGAEDLYHPSAVDSR
jgi:hypothetical protein